jgi:PTH1 family peptidyl-tRNA hydrolase
MSQTRVVACLGNPGSEYSTTRHNVGWWLADRLADAWGLGRFRRRGQVATAGGEVGGVAVEVVKPMTYMNRSGAALAPLREVPGFEVTRDLLVVVDDVALEPGRVRFRSGGSAGGHNGLKSIEAVLGTREYARLRIGVGAKPPEVELAEWVLASPSREDRQAILGLFPELVQGVALWLTEGVEAAMNQCNGLGGSEPES